MRFYLACIMVFALMLFALRSCGAVYVSVAQASLHHGKGGEAQGRRLKRHHKYYGSVHDSRGLRWSALSAAVPAPHERVSAGTIERKAGDRFDTVTQEPGRTPQQIQQNWPYSAETQSSQVGDVPEASNTPQQIIDEVFLNIGWK